MADVIDRQYLLIGEGTIGASQRVTNGEITQEAVNQFVASIAGAEYDTAIAATATPDTCVDGRNTQAGACAAGGSFSVVIGDALTNNAYRTAKEQAPAHARQVFQKLQAIGKSVGGHGDNHAQGANCGCGAEDKLDATDPNSSSILRYLTRRGAAVREVIESLGVAVSNDLHERIVTNAQALQDEGYATTGAELAAVTREVGGEQAVQIVYDAHNEVAVRINTKRGTTINRQKLRVKYGEHLQVFELDVWALQNAAEALTVTSEAAHNMYIATLYYNVATTAVLSDNSLQIIVR